MRAVDLIARKREGQTLTADEIGWLIRGYVGGTVPDYQMSAWLMAVCWRGLDDDEVAALTDAMVDTGGRLDLSSLGPVVADKHSTGGVGDKTTLVLAPVVAAAGLPFAKMSGRGLGHTGGTLDKLESIPGFRTDLSPETFVRQVQEIGVAVTGQSARLVPADRLLYALRDVTATVDDLGLIVSSVMSKKFAAGATTVVLDVTVGEGAFFQDPARARQAGRAMIRLGRRAGMQVSCVLSAMDDPLGWAVGNALEVEEAVSCLQGRGPEDLRALVGDLAGRLLSLSGGESLDEGRRRALATLDDGSAHRVFRRWVAAQGGPPEDAPLELPQAPLRVPVHAPTEGWVDRVHARRVAQACLSVGAGRETKEAAVDPAAGVVIHAPAGTPVDRGDVLAVIHAAERVAAGQAARLMDGAFDITAHRPAPRHLIIDIIDQDGAAHGERPRQTGGPEGHRA